MNNQSGMISIEAAVIIPITIAVTMLIIWLGIFFYIQNVMDVCSNQAAIVGSHLADLDNNEIQDITTETLNTLLADNLVMMDDVTSDISVDFGSVTVHVEGSLNIPSFFLFGDIYDTKFWSIDITNSAPRLISSMFVRTITNLK